MVDISVRTMSELVLLSFLILISAVINAVIYGQFAVLTEELKRKTNEFLEKLDSVNLVLKIRGLPKDV